MKSLSLMASQARPAASRGKRQGQVASAHCAR
jgi:hypothetical protein